MSFEGVDGGRRRLLEEPELDMLEEISGRAPPGLLNDEDYEHFYGHVDTLELSTGGHFERW